MVGSCNWSMGGSDTYEWLLSIVQSHCPWIICRNMNVFQDLCGGGGGLRWVLGGNGSFLSHVHAQVPLDEWGGYPGINKDEEIPCRRMRSGSYIKAMGDDEQWGVRYQPEDLAPKGHSPWCPHKICPTEAPHRPPKVGQGQTYSGFVFYLAVLTQQISQVTKSI